MIRELTRIDANNVHIEPYSKISEISGSNMVVVKVMTTTEIPAETVTPVAPTRRLPMHPDRRVKPQPPVSWEAFLEWVDEDSHAEWVNGEIIEMAPFTDDHVDIRDFLIEVVRAYVRWKQLGWAPGGFFMRTEPRPSSREPDLVFVATERLGISTGTYLNGPADLVVEIVSPDSVTRDRGEKFEEYEAAGVREYWVIDPLHDEALFYQLQTDGTYRAAELDAEGWYHSMVLPGFRLKPAWLWRVPLQHAQAALYTIGGEAYVNYLLELMRSQPGEAP
jgi:Uma2 family endonuclease